MINVNIRQVENGFVATLSNHNHGHNCLGNYHKEFIAATLKELLTILEKETSNE